VITADALRCQREHVDHRPASSLLVAPSFHRRSAVCSRGNGVRHAMELR
jgi:hypothetical protein